MINTTIFGRYSIIPSVTSKLIFVSMDIVYWSSFSLWRWTRGIILFCTIYYLLSQQIDGRDHSIKKKDHLLKGINIFKAERSNITTLHETATDGFYGRTTNIQYHLITCVVMHAQESIRVWSTNNPLNGPSLAVSSCFK